MVKRRKGKSDGQAAPMVGAGPSVVSQAKQAEPAGSGGPVVGLALGSGSARGWAHIGVIEELQAMGIEPQVVAGTSIGALVGAVYAIGELDKFTEWVRALTVRDVFGLMDFRFAGGMVKGERLFGYFGDAHTNPDIESLERRYVSVATDMKSGREIWITRGPILPAARASCAMPGVLAPVQHQGRWMLDGGMVNPVPVSACRALGADVVIAVNLNAQLVGTHLPRGGREEARRSARERKDGGLWQKVTEYFGSDDDDDPGMFDVLAASVNVMQDRITRSRMAGDPAEVALVPMLPDFALMDFHRAKEAIEAGRDVVRRRATEIRQWTRGSEPAGDSRGSEPAGD